MAAALRHRPERHVDDLHPVVRPVDGTSPCDHTGAGAVHRPGSPRHGAAQPAFVGTVSGMSAARLPGLVLTEHTFAVPLDHSAPDGARIEVFAREAVASDRAGDDLPWLVYLQ